MGDKYDASELTNHITYMDANNLYGWAMCKHMVLNGRVMMNFMNGKEFPVFWKFDLHYPMGLHDLHKDSP